MADRIAERSQSEGVEKDVHLVADSEGTILKIFVIEAESWIDEQFLQRELLRLFNLAAEIIVHGANRIAAQVVVSDFADVAALDKTNNYARIKILGHPVEVLALFAAGKVDQGSAGFEALARDGQAVCFDRDWNLQFFQSFYNWQQFRILRGIICNRGMGESGFRANIDDIGPLRLEDVGPSDRSVSCKADAFAVPRAPPKG